MPTPLSSATIAIVRATVPALETHGLAITQRMYDRLFENPEVRASFNQSHHGEIGLQPKALANAILAYARNIDNLGSLGGMVERIAQKHAALNILPEHYTDVASALQGAITDVLGPAATSDIRDAWSEAYWFLADVLIAREAAIYRDQASQLGGWNGWRDFIIESVTDENAIIRSFTLVPADKGRVLAHRPGQYLGLLLDVPGHGICKRNYSISCAPNTYSYRITVKRDAAPNNPAGIVSNWLHDRAPAGTKVWVAAPAGDFFLTPEDEAPIVLVSGGIGLTPMVSMLEAVAEINPTRELWFVHGALNGAVHAMREHVRSLAVRVPSIRSRIFYAEPGAGDRQGEHFDEAGLIKAEWLERNTPLQDATYYLCGPKPFLRALLHGLLDRGVPAERVRYEFFGPADELLQIT